MPVLPDGNYPDHYDDSINLSGTSLFSYYNEPLPCHETIVFGLTFGRSALILTAPIMKVTADMRDKIFLIATFMEASIERGWMSTKTKKAKETMDHKGAERTT
jgi:hypothetical protein